jgi:glycosyltransferase involved in cell wall biosynthesis
MWAMNGERFLPLVLRRVEDAIPKEFVHKRILVDDHSTDDTARIARDFNWEVYLNPSTGISSGANEALRHVDCKYFMSLEQDLLLSDDWVKKIPKYMEHEDVAVAQGVRYSTEPTLRKIDAYAYKRVALEGNPERFGLSMDNNIFKTRFVKEVGGFPSECPVCTDGILMWRLREAGHRWLIDTSVVSDHIRPSLKEFYSHQYNLINRCVLSPVCPTSTNMKRVLRIFITSPVRAAMMALQMRHLPILWVYPRYRYYRARALTKHLKDCGKV